MGVRVFKNSFFLSILPSFAPFILTLFIVGFFVVALRQTEEASRSEGHRLLEEAITRVVIHNYAVKGYFPESLAYITENYGIHIDTALFVVHYEVFASNLLPDIRVFERVPTILEPV